MPIIAEIEPPPALGRVDRCAVIALTVAPERLMLLRKARASRKGGIPSPNYASRDQVQRDLDWAELLLRRERWATVDVTNKSIEECATEIIAQQHRRTGRTL